MEVLHHYLQGGMTLENNLSSLKSYVYKPIDSQLIKYDESLLFDVENEHLEYFPIVNQRVFALGGQEQSTA